MKRGEAISQLGILLGLAFVPGLAKLQPIRQYTKFYLYQSFVRGFRFHKGPGLLGTMRAGDALEMVRDANNPHDPNAVALHFNQQMIGYLPAEDNPIISRLLHIGEPLMAEITHLKHEAKAWEQVAIAIFLLKEAKPEAKTGLAEMSYLSVLTTPHYYSLRGTDGSVVQIPRAEPNEGAVMETPEEPDDAWGGDDDLNDEEADAAPLPAGPSDGAFPPSEFTAWPLAMQAQLGHA